jgi:hypothetical protein
MSEKKNETKLSKPVYALYGGRPLKLPQDLILLEFALHELKCAGYDGDLYADAKCKRSLGPMSKYL